jgi:hypothetical protein
MLLMPIAHGLRGIVHPKHNNSEKQRQEQRDNSEQMAELWGIDPAFLRRKGYRSLIIFGKNSENSKWLSCAPCARLKVPAAAKPPGRSPSACVDR